MVALTGAELVQVLTMLPWLSIALPQESDDPSEYRQLAISWLVSPAVIELTHLR